MGHFRPQCDVVLPTLPIPLRTRVHMKRRRQSFAEKFLVDDHDPLLAVEVIPSRLVDEQAEVGGCPHCDPKTAQRAYHLPALRAERPPPFKRAVLCSPA